MTQSLKLGDAGSQDGPNIKRLNRVPVIVAILLVVIFLAVIFYGLSSRGLHFGGDPQIEPSSARPASNDAERLKQGVPDGIIGEPQPVVVQPSPSEEPERPRNPFQREPEPTPTVVTAPEPTLESEEVWRARLQREQDEQVLREYQRQRMASIQAEGAAFDSPDRRQPEGSRKHERRDDTDVSANRTDDCEPAGKRARSLQRSAPVRHRPECRSEWAGIQTAIL
jgi:type IV secretory pathway VirB10-like protein